MTAPIDYDKVRRTLFEDAGGNLAASNGKRAAEAEHLMTAAQVQATLALVAETARLADAQERAADMLKAQALIALASAAGGPDLTRHLTDRAMSLVGYPCDGAPPASARPSVGDAPLGQRRADES